jgi:hypothetical protein
MDGGKLSSFVATDNYVLLCLFQEVPLTQVREPTLRR